MQALIKDKKGKFLKDKLSENIGAKIYQTKRLPQQAYASIRKKSGYFLPGQSQTVLKNILRILQVILLRSLLTLQKNLEYLQCASNTRELTYVKKT